MLGKITTAASQEYVVKRGLKKLFENNSTACVNNLLIALEGKEFLNKNLKDIAIRKVFKKGAEDRSTTWAKDFYDHPAIIPRVYAYGIVVSAKDRKQNSLFQWLLTEADRMDLLTVQKRSDYAWKSPKFRAAIRASHALYQT